MPPLRVPSAASLVLVCALAACEMPRFEGPQIQGPPPGFTLQPDTRLDRVLLGDRPVIGHDTWVRAQWGEFSGIYINAHAGPTGIEEVEAAREAALDRPPARSDQVRDFGQVERLRIDGREAFGWPEIVRSDARGVKYVAYRAVVPYDTVSYAVEFVSGDPAFKMRPDSLRSVVASFAVGRTEYNLPLILVVAGILVFLLARWRPGLAERQRRSASVHLPKIPRPDAEEESGGAPPTAAAVEGRPPPPG